MRAVYGLRDTLQKVALTVDDALRAASTPGGKSHACGLVHAEFHWSPALPRGVRHAAQPNYANRWRDGFDGSMDILSREDQGWPRILQHLAQPVARIESI